MAKREQARAQQRVAFELAMVDAIAAKGYRSTTVADLTARTGTSRKTFYQHFANKQECFLSTYDQVSARAIRRMEQAYRDAAGWPGRVEAAIEALFEAAVENPGAVRLSLVEINALGPAGIERRERSSARYERFIREALELAPGGGTMSETVLTAVVGGLMRVLYRRVLRREQRRKLLALVPDLVTWATSYYPTPQALVEEPHPVGDRQEPRRVLEGGRAPGSLAPHARLNQRRGLPRGDQNVSRSFVIHSQRERVLDAVANLTAANGYAELKVEDIAETAAISLNAFYEHFADKEDAFLVAYELGHAKALAYTEHAYSEESEWPIAVRAGLGALLEFLAAEPAFAHIALIDSLIATDRTAERSHAGVSAFAKMLVPGLDEAPGQGTVSAVTIEAIAGGVFELCLRYAFEGRIRELPELTSSATYVALAPFLGSAKAARIATGPTAKRGPVPAQ